MVKAVQRGAAESHAECSARMLTKEFGILNNETGFGLHSLFGSGHLKKDALRDNFLITYGFDFKCGLHRRRPNQNSLSSEYHVCHVFLCLETLRSLPSISNNITNNIQREKQGGIPLCV